MQRVPKGRYTGEFREETVKLVTEEGLSLPEAGRRLSLPTSTIRNWVQAFKSGKLGDVGKSRRPLTDIENGAGAGKNGARYIKKSGRILCEGVAAGYAMMKKMRLQYTAPLMSRILNVSTSGYYAWANRPPSKWAKEETRLEIEIRADHKRTRRTCGPERLQRNPADHGIDVGVSRIKRIRKKARH
jgi:transposase-like protein